MTLAGQGITHDEALSGLLYICQGIRVAGAHLTAGSNILAVAEAACESESQEVEREACVGRAVGQVLSAVEQQRDKAMKALAYLSPVSMH